VVLSTYSSYLIVNKDLSTSLNRVASEAVTKRETDYYQKNIGKVKTVDDFMSDYRLYSYAVKAHGLEDMAYARAFMKKVLESDLTDSSSFANTLTDKRYKDFASAFNFAGSTKTAQTTAQESDLVSAYETSFTAEEKAINDETAYYDKAIDKVTNVDQLIGNERLITYAMKANGIYNEYFSKAKMKDLLIGDLSDTNSAVYKTYGGPRASLTADNTDKQAVISAIDNRTSLKARNTELDTLLADSTITDEERTAYEEEKATNETTISDIETNLQSAVGTVDDAELAAIKSQYKTAIQSNNAKIAQIDVMLGFKAQFSFKPDGTLVNATAQTATQKAAIEEKYLHTVSTNPSYTLFKNDKDHFEAVINSATSVDDLVNDSRVVSFIKTAYELNSFVSASTIRAMMLSDPSNSNSVAAINGLPDFSRLFNFNADGTVKDGMKAMSNSNITYTNSRGSSITVNPLSDVTSKYKTNYLYAFQDEIDVAMENYQKRIDAVNTIDDLFVTNSSYWTKNATTSTEKNAYNKSPELWEMALESFGLDPSNFSKTKIERILESDLNSKTSYANILKDDKVIAFAKAFNFDAKGNEDVPVQAQSEQVVNELATDYRSQMTRFKTGAAKTAAGKLADSEIAYYKEQMQRITSVDELLADSRLVNVMLKSRAIDPASVTTKDLKKMFASDLSDPKSFVNTQTNKNLTELVASFNFDVKGKMTESASVLGTVQQRGDVMETVNKYVRQTMEEEQGNSNEGVRLALYFSRKANDVTSAYDILGDNALSQFFTTTFSLSTYFSNMEVTAQADMVSKYIDLKKLSDPKYVQSLVQRFTAMYDTKNSSASASAALTILTS